MFFNDSIEEEENQNNKFNGFIKQNKNPKKLFFNHSIEEDEIPKKTFATPKNKFNPSIEEEKTFFATPKNKFNHSTEKENIFVTPKNKFNDSTEEEKIPKKIFLKSKNNKFNDSIKQKNPKKLFLTSRKNKFNVYNDFNEEGIFSNNSDLFAEEEIFSNNSDLLKKKRSELFEKIKTQSKKSNQQWFTLLNYIDCLKLSDKQIKNYPAIIDEKNKLIISRLFSITYKYVSNYIDIKDYLELCLDLYKYYGDINKVCNIIFYKLSLFLFSKNFIYTEKEIRSILAKIIFKFNVYCSSNSINNPLTLEKIMLFHNNVSKINISKSYYEKNILLMR